MHYFRFALIALSVLLMPVLLLQGLANARMSGGPIQWNGFWEADLARAFLQADDSDGQLRISINDIGLSFARSAFEKEPFATDALFLFVVDERARGNDEAVREILKIGVALDKRNQRLGAFEMEQAISARDYTKTFAVIDRLTTINPSLIDELVQPLASAMGQPDMVPVVRTALEAQPAWAEAFWRAAPANEDGLLAMYDLRQQIDFGTSEESDAAMLSGLVQTGNYSEAFDFWDQAKFIASGNEFGFVETTQSPPLGWQATITGSRSFTETQPGIFSVFVEEQTFGELARQLVRLDAGSYNFSADVSPAIEDAALNISLQCAENGNEVGNVQSLAEGPAWTVTQDCNFFWLLLSGTAWERNSPVLGEVSNMALARR